MEVFPHYDVTSAPERSRAFLRGSEQTFGFVPSPVARLANPPAVLETFFAASKRFEEASLVPLEREVLAMTVGRHNGCHYCVAMHTAILTRTGAPEELIGALRAGTPRPDARLAALARFVGVVLATRGEAPEDEVSRFFAAGFGAEHALDVVLGVAVYTLSTYANRLTRAPLDPAFAPFAP